MSKKTRLLYLHHQGEMGGAERSLLALFSALDRARFELSVACPARGRFAHALRDGGIAHVAFEFGGLRRLGSLLANVGRLTRWVRREKVDLIHSNGPQTNVVSGLVGLLTPAHVVWHARNLLLPGMLDWDRWFSPLAGHIICNSQAIRSRFENARCYAQRTSVILNAVDWERVTREGLSKDAARTKTGISQSGFVVGTFDRLDPMKEHETVLRGFKEVHDVLPGSLLLVVGEAFRGHEETRESLERLARDLGVHKAVGFLGFRDDVFSLMSACDVVVLASAFEGCSRVLCEAQALGRPVVAANAGGNPELVEDGKTGFLFPVGNDKELSRRIVELLTNPELMEETGRHARERALRDFTMERYHRETVRVYESVLELKPQHGVAPEAEQPVTKNRDNSGQRIPRQNQGSGVIRLVDLESENEPLRSEILQALDGVIRSRAFILGPEVEKLEESLASYCGAEFAVGVSSGTDGLLLSLMALDIGPGDEVITTPYSFFSTAGSVARVGARPVFADIDPLTYNIDPSRIEAALTPRTKAIIPVHLYGQCAEMERILDTAGRKGLRVVEDAAQAIGAEYRDGRRAGSMGDLGCLSFYPTKNLGAMGDAGMVLTGDGELADELRTLRVHGEGAKYHHHRLGGNFRLDSLQAAVLNVKLRHLDRWVTRRQENARRYAALFEGSGLLDVVGLMLPDAAYGTASIEHYHTYNQYVIRAPRREALRDYLATRGIGTEVYYPLPLHLQPCFRYLGYGPGDFPQSERAAKETLALPIHPNLSEEEQRRVVQEIKEFYLGRAR